MRVLFILETGIPEYRNFLFERLTKDERISELLVLHNGQTYNGHGNYNSKKIKFIGNTKFGFHLGILKYIMRYDVVVSSYNLRIVSCWLPVFLKSKWIFWGKGLGNNESFLVTFLRKVTSGRAKKILVYNEYKKQEMIEKLNIDENKVIAYQNSIEILNPGFNSLDDKNYFLYFGRIQERKGLQDLVNQYLEYTRKRISVNTNIAKLRIVGNGDFKVFLMSKIDEWGLNSYVEFHEGVYDDTSIKEHFKNAIAYVSPYNVGLAVINSLAYGVPIITVEKPQVGPEFHYLNNNNSFILKDVSKLGELFDRISNEDLSEINHYCLNYYLEYLNCNIMYNRFIEAIIEVGN